MGIRTQDIFNNICATSIHATRLSDHIKKINYGLYTLLNANKLHPDLVEWPQLEREINDLRGEARLKVKKLIL